MDHTPQQLSISHCFEAPADVVFQYWLDEKYAGQWLFTHPQGQLKHASFDARVGGRYRIVELRKGRELVHSGEYLQISPPHQLLFSLYPPVAQAEPDLVWITLRPMPFGCELTLTLQLYQQKRSTAKLVDDWTQLLMALAAELNNHPADYQPAALLAKRLN